MDGQQANDGGGREFQRVADELRFRMTNGTYPEKSFLPSQRDLAEELGVSRDTVQRALRELVDEGWIESKQGSGSRVIKTQRIQSSAPKATRSRRGMTLEFLVGEAFEQSEVTLDVYTLTSESLYWLIQQQAHRIRSRSISPQRITLRMLLPAEQQTLPYPRVKGDPQDTRLRERLHGITERHTKSLRESLGALKTEGWVPTVDVEIRRAPLTPTFKLYMFNGMEALHGPYEVIERNIALDSGEEITALDVLGLGATLTHHIKDEDPDSAGSIFVGSMQKWFNSVWELLSEKT
ncbi:winged helix-turn-helix domain-containing protein [Streptomyces sp. NPDC005799]|uniref:winged helix-turn-helix domain-containing protein n=1 Tax=Streptomyces sp. NPDC005799 TaxID=3154678 RepID=UPI0033C27161